MTSEISRRCSSEEKSEVLALRDQNTQLKELVDAR
jgi:hypothetical protein